MNKKEKRQTLTRSLLSLLGKGTISNENAKTFLEENSSKLTNMEILQRISDSFYELSSLTEAEAAVLTDILDRHNLLYIPPINSNDNSDSTDEPKNQISLLNGLLKITDCSPVEQSIQDEYDFILGSSPSMRLYKIDLEENNLDFTVQFTNYLYGKICMDPKSKNYNEKNLELICSRKRIVQALLDNYGFISSDQKSKSSMELQKEMILKLVKTLPSSSIKRVDGSNISILKVGGILISKNGKLTEKLDQYLIFSNSRYYLSYGKINFSLMKISPEYKHGVANILLGYKNLNSSRYIGTLLANKIARSDIPFNETTAVSEIL